MHVVECTALPPGEDRFDRAETAIVENMRLDSDEFYRALSDALDPSLRSSFLGASDPQETLRKKCVVLTTGRYIQIVVLGNPFLERRTNHESIRKSAYEVIERLLPVNARLH
jgi:hypothetical protein